MKATGIVRRVDDLGRIIIPKEIRRTLRIHDGDPMEIFIEDGGVYFKKYSPFAELKDYAQKYADTLSNTTNCICIITDRDTIIGVSGVSKRDYFEHGISSELENVITEKVVVTAKDESQIIPVVTNDSNIYYSQIIVPIKYDGEIAGSVVLISKDKNLIIGLTEQKLAEAGAKFLGKILEE